MPNPALPNKTKIDRKMINESSKFFISKTYLTNGIWLIRKEFVNKIEMFDCPGFTDDDGYTVDIIKKSDKFMTNVFPKGKYWKYEKTNWVHGENPRFDARLFYRNPTIKGSLLDEKFMILNRHYIDSFGIKVLYGYGEKKAFSNRPYGRKPEFLIMPMLFPKKDMIVQFRRLLKF